MNNRTFSKILERLLYNRLYNFLTEHNILSMFKNKIDKFLVSSLKSQVVSLQTAHSWANAGVLLGEACIGTGVAFEAI